MRKPRILLLVTILGVALIGAPGCETKPDDVRYEYPAPDEERIRPNSPIPQMGTDGFEDDD